MTISINTSVKLYCDSFDCPSGYALIDTADDEECTNRQCKTSTCCDKVCSSFTCPKKLALVEDADTTVCKDNMCTSDQCCKDGESYSPAYLHALLFPEYPEGSTNLSYWRRLSYSDTVST